MVRTTEEESHYAGLDGMSTAALLQAMNAEDRTVPLAVAGALDQIRAAVDDITQRMRRGGRVFYLGAGTSGRLAVTDASEILPTFGVDGRFIGIMAGGDKAIRRPVEGAEDDPNQGWRDILAYDPGPEDCLVGISASGSTPYVVGAMQAARAQGLLTVGICCNTGTAVAAEADRPIVAVVGPEFVTGSTRLKAGTAIKLILNMLSTVVMIQLGHVKGNRMVDMQLTNRKLIDRGTRMVMAETKTADYQAARDLLLRYGSVRAAIDHSVE